MLDFLPTPAARAFLKIGIVVENPAQMVRIGAAIGFDQARRLDDSHDLQIELAPIETIPGNVVERPVAHDASPLAASVAILSRLRDRPNRTGCACSNSSSTGSCSRTPRLSRPSICPR